VVRQRDDDAMRSDERRRALKHVRVAGDLLDLYRADQLDVRVARKLRLEPALDGV